MSKSATLTLRPATEADITELMTWFKTREQLESWAGPGIAYPFNFESFQQGLKLATLSSWVLTDETQVILGFGQYYRRIERCHLGRLAINPKHRGEGLSQPLLEQLIAMGKTDLRVATASLFVLDHNAVAIASYQKMGFDFADYPEAMPLDNCLYMIKPI